MSLQDGDLLMVDREGTQFQVKSEDTSNLRDTDLFWVQREGVNYSVTADQVNIGENSVAPDIDSAILTENSPGGDRFTNSSFTTNIIYTEQGSPAPVVGMKAKVSGALSVAGVTSPITDVVGNVLTLTDRTNLDNGAFVVDDVVTGYTSGNDPSVGELLDDEWPQGEDEIYANMTWADFTADQSVEYGPVTGYQIFSSTVPVTFNYQSGTAREIYFWFGQNQDSGQAITVSGDVNNPGSQVITGDTNTNQSKIFIQLQAGVGSFTLTCSEGNVYCYGRSAIGQPGDPPVTVVSISDKGADPATMTVSSGNWEAGQTVKNTVVNPITAEPESDEITGVDGSTLTLASSDGLANFAEGYDVYQDSGYTAETSSITSVTGSTDPDAPRFFYSNSEYNTLADLEANANEIASFADGPAGNSGQYWWYWVVGTGEVRTDGTAIWDQTGDAGFTVTWNAVNGGPWTNVSGSYGGSEYTSFQWTSNQSTQDTYRIANGAYIIRFGREGKNAKPANPIAQGGASSSAVLGFGTDKDLSVFKKDDVVQGPYKVVSVGPGNTMTVDGGSWSPNDTVSCTYEAGTGTVDSTSDSTMTLTNIGNDYPKRWVAGKGKYVTGDSTPVLESSAYVVFDSTGNVSRITAGDPGYVNLVGYNDLQLRFGDSLGTGQPTDTELPPNTSLTTYVRAVNSEGSSSATSNSVTPAVDGLRSQPDSVLQATFVDQATRWETIDNRYYIYQGDKAREELSKNLDRITDKIAKYNEKQSK